MLPCHVEKDAGGRFGLIELGGAYGMRRSLTLPEAAIPAT